MAEKPRTSKVSGLLASLGDEMRTCNLCDKPHRARGLCGYHYKRQFPAPEKTTVATCDGCGVKVQRIRPDRWAATHCSELCRQWTAFGPWSCGLPSDHWARTFGATCEYTPIRHQDCDWCGTVLTTKKATQHYCSRPCMVRAGRAARRAREHGAVGTYTWADITRLWILFDRCCAYCRMPTPLPLIQAEHVEPLSRGGANNLSNLLPSCGPCNADKRDLWLDAWAADRERRHLPTVTTSWDETDPLYSHLTGRTHLRLVA